MYVFLVLWSRQSGIKYCLQEEPVEEQLVGNTGEDEIARRKIDERALDFRPRLRS